MILPPYVDRGGEQVFRPPFLARGVDFYGFLVAADRDRIQAAVCDRYLNGPSGGREDFRAAGAYALLVFCSLPSLASTDPTYHRWGWFSEQEAAFWILLVDHRRERFVWFHPYIWVDNAYAMAMGREVYGFPKGLGWFDVPPSGADPERFAMDTLALPALTPETQGRRERMLEVRREGPASPARERWSEPLHMAADLKRVLGAQVSAWGDLRLALDSVDDLFHKRIPMVFLKQFRDVARPAAAVHQAVVEVDSRLVRFHHGSLLPGEWKVEVGDFPSHPIRADLGLAPGAMRPLLSFHVNFDFEIGAGREVWSPGRQGWRWPDLRIFRGVRQLATRGGD